MIYKNLELHNVKELYEAKGGIALCRVPQKLGDFLDNGGRWGIPRTGGVEIRFVPESSVYITLSTLEPNTRANLTVYYGSSQIGTLHFEDTIIDNTPRKIRFVASPETEFLDIVHKGFNKPFSKNVVRILCDGKPIVIHSVEGNARPPKKDELPDKTILFYGSSITHGVSAVLGNLNWPFILAERLKVDEINLGFPDGCRFQHEMADYIATRQDYDAIFLEIGINFFGEDNAIIKERVLYMLNALRKNHPDKYIFCTDMFYAFTNKEQNKVKLGEVRKLVRDIVLGMNDPKIVYFDAMEALGEDKADLIAEDHIHPSIMGNLRIAEYFERKLSPYIAKI